MERISTILERILARVTSRPLETQAEVARIAQEILKEWGLPEPEDLWVEGETLYVEVKDPLLRQELSARSGEWQNEISRRMGKEVIRQILWRRRRKR